jgi:hypothetical protein
MHLEHNCKSPNFMENLRKKKKTSVHSSPYQSGKKEGPGVGELCGAPPCTQSPTFLSPFCFFCERH